MTGLVDEHNNEKDSIVTDPEDHFDEVIEEENETIEDTNQEENETEESQEADSEENQSELNQLKDENADLNDRLLRLQADFDNYKRRMKKEKETDLKYKSQELATEIIPALDNFERALQTGADQENVASFIEGVEMVYQQLQQALEKVGVTEIEAEGKEFDPTVHQAVMQVQEDGFESNQVIEVLQKGYQLKDRVIRPAMVKVNQ